MAPSLVIALVGGSGSGKTRLADRLQFAFGSAVTRFCQDDFYRDLSHLPPSSRPRVNFDHPRAIEWPLFEQAIRACIAGRSTRVPVYDFATHCRTGKSRKTKAGRLIIVDGLWLLRRPSMRSLFDVRVFLDCATATRLRRRLARDTAMRGRTSASVQKQFWSTVEPMHKKYVRPQRAWADVILPEGWGEREIRRLITLVKKRLDRDRNSRGAKPAEIP